MWQAQYLCVVVRRWVAFLVGGAALRRPPASFGVAGVALQTCRVACFLRIALSGLHQVVTTCKFRGLRYFEVVSLGFVRKQVLMWYCVAHYTFNFTLYTWHFTSTLYTALHLTLRTLHSTLYTSHFTLHTLHFILYTLHFTLRTLHFTFYTPHITLYSGTLHLTVCTLHFTLYA